LGGGFCVRAEAGTRKRTLSPITMESYGGIVRRIGVGTAGQISVGAE
jgi:hypothetical protein